MTKTLFTEALVARSSDVYEHYLLGLPQDCELIRTADPVTGVIYNTRDPELDTYMESEKVNQVVSQLGQDIKIVKAGKDNFVKLVRDEKLGLDVDGHLVTKTLNNIRVPG